MRTRRSVLGLLAATSAVPTWAAASHGRDAGEALAAAAHRQIGVTKNYDHAYRKLAYPGGDVPRSTGVCADVVVRAARDAWGVDLQQRLHEDMTQSFSAYPQTWGLTGPDHNIDHRRVPNLEAYWTRQGARLWRAKSWTLGFAFPGPLLPGDILTWRTFPNGGPHVAIVTAGGTWPRIAQNSGWGTREDLLAEMFADAAIGHFRWRPVRT